MNKTDSDDKGGKLLKDALNTHKPFTKIVFYLYEGE